MSRRLVFITALLVNLFISGPVQAQPAVVQRALDDINTRTGRSLTLNDLNWRYSQNVYNGNNLGCPHIQNTSGGPVSIVGYQVEFDEGLDDVWEWDFPIQSVFASLLNEDPNDPLWFVQQSPSEIAVYTQAVELITILDIARFGSAFMPLDVYKRDGQSLLLASNTLGQLSLWELNPTTPTPVQPILAPFGKFDDAVFTGGDFGLFAAINGTSVNFYDASGGQIGTIDTAIIPAKLAFGINAPTGTLAVGGLSAERTSEVQLWDVGSQTLQHTLLIPLGVDAPTPVMHPYLTIVAAMGHTQSGYHMYLWDMATGTTVFDQSIPANGQLTFSMDGKMLFAALENGQILGWVTYY